MKLTGMQVYAIHEISDGAEVDITRKRGQNFIEIHRLEDNFIIRIRDDGTESVIKEPDN